VNRCLFSGSVGRAKVDSQRSLQVGVRVLCISCQRETGHTRTHAKKQGRRQDKDEPTNGVTGALYALVKRLRVSYNQNDETRSGT